MKKKTLEQIVSAAITRALTAMHDKSDRPMHTFRAGEINGWTGDALASYVIPKVLRSMRRART